MMNPDIRLLALDLDNTLLNSKKIISEENKRMLVQCERAGIHVVTASGRFFHSQIDFTDQLNPEISSVVETNTKDFIILFCRHCFNGLL